MRPAGASSGHAGYREHVGPAGRERQRLLDEARTAHRYPASRLVGYDFSTLHCMTVSLGLGGDGLGTAWGHQLATSMLRDAGFSQVEVREIEDDPLNS